MINSLIPPALRFVLHNTGINSVPYWIWGFLFLYLRIPGEAALCRAVKASNKPGVAVVRQWLSPPHYHSHHGPDDCNYLPARSLRPVSFSDSQSALRRCFFVRLSFPLICSRPSACSSDVSHPLQQSINPLKWECKSVISEFTLTTHETVDIAQIGFSKKTLLIPGLSVRQPVLILFASSLTRYELCHLRMTHQTAALFVTLCVRPCVCLPERQYSKQYEKTKAGVNMPSIRGWPGRLLGWRTVNTQGGHNTTQTPDMKVIHTSPAIKSYHCYSSRFLENE